MESDHSVRKMALSKEFQMAMKRYQDLERTGEDDDDDDDDDDDGSSKVQGPTARFGRMMTLRLLLPPTMTYISVVIL